MWRKIGRWAASALVGQAAQIFVWPLLPPVGVGVMGWLQGIPWFYLAVGIMLAFAAGITWLVQFDQWRYRNTAANKLLFHSARINRTQDELGRATAVSIGVNLQSTALFPIRIRIAEMNTQYRDHYPPRREYENREMTIQPYGYGWFDDFYIDIPIQEEGAHVAYLQCQIEYGKPGRLSHSLVIRQKLFVTINSLRDVVWVQWVEQ